jgi:hypothetical protein
MSDREENDRSQSDRDKAAIACVVAEAPRLTAEQRERIARIINGGSARR